jgi:hypothetical protein
MHKQPVTIDEHELRFHCAMLTIYARASAECVYVATRFLNMVSNDGGRELGYVSSTGQ